jgi:RNA polymerase sigma-70 factor (ECF subfamily)
MVLSESDLLRRARRLEENALGEIYDTYSPELYRYAYRLIGDSEPAEDLVAETFHRFLRVLHRGGGPRNHLRSYLYRILHNLAMDHHRSNKGRGEPMVLDENIPSEVSVSESAEQIVEAREARRMLWKLTPDQRQVLVLKYLQGFTNSEIAATLSKPVGAVKALQHRGLTALRRHLAHLEK